MKKTEIKTVDIDKVIPSRYRDFERYPNNERQVLALMQSYTEHGDFGVLPVRECGDFYELIAGHHRLEANRRLGNKTIDIKIDNYNDDRAIMVMIDENMKQQAGEQNVAAILDSMCAAMERITYLTLTEEWKDRSPLKKIYKDARTFKYTRNRIQQNRGTVRSHVGVPEITRYLNGRLTGDTIKTTFTLIISSNEYNKIYKKVYDRIRAEKGDEFVPSTALQVPYKPQFDARIATLFTHPKHVQQFRISVTGETLLAKILPYDKQFEFAQACTSFYSTKGMEMTTQRINEYLSSHVVSYLSTLRDIEKEELERGIKGAIDKKLRSHFDHLVGTFRRAERYRNYILELLKTYPVGLEPPVPASSYEIAKLLPQHFHDFTEFQKILKGGIIIAENS